MIIFDCDGVLVDSEVVVVKHEEASLRAAGINLSFDEIVDRYVGLSYGAMAASITEEFSVDLPGGFFDRVQAEALATFPQELRPVPGMVEFVRAVVGPKCVASSSDLDRILLSLDLTGHRAHFEDAHIFSAQMVEHGKPAPDLFLHAAARMAQDPRECVVIEDSPHGVRAGVAAGMRVIGLVAGGHCSPASSERLLVAGADAIARSAAELPDLVR